MDVTNKTTVSMPIMDGKKHSVKFSNEAKDLPFDNLYVKREAIPNDCIAIRVTVEFIK